MEHIRNISINQEEMNRDYKPIKIDHRGYSVYMIEDQKYVPESTINGENVNLKRYNPLTK